MQSSPCVEIKAISCSTIPKVFIVLWKFHITISYICFFGNLLFLQQVNTKKFALQELICNPHGCARESYGWSNRLNCKKNISFHIQHKTTAKITEKIVIKHNSCFDLWGPCALHVNTLVDRRRSKIGGGREDNIHICCIKLLLNSLFFTKYNMHIWIWAPLPNVDLTWSLS